MRKYYALATILIVSMLAFSWKTQEGKAQVPSSKTAVDNGILSTVMSPEVQRGPMTGFFPKQQSLSMAKRLDTLENKTVYLIENGFGGSHNFMVELEKWFDEHMPSVNTVRQRKPGMVFGFMDEPADTALWKEAKEKSHAVIMGVAG